MPGLFPILPLPAPPADGNLGPLPHAQVTNESIDGDNANKNQNTDGKENLGCTPVATHTKPIGIIHPPPDIRNIIDTTAEHVAMNGPKFEKKIAAINAGKETFNFLIASDPYHGYYQHRVSEEIRSQGEAAPTQPPTDGQDLEADKGDKISDASIAEEKPDKFAQFRTVCKVLEPPEAEQYTVRIPDGITGEEMDIIKLTAQFVALNGNSFLTGLTSREINSPQFHFLKPSHRLHMFFTALVYGHSKVLMPPEGLIDKLKNSIVDKTTVLERCLHRLEWEKSQEQARQKAESEIEQERVQMAIIDWHDFVVVEAMDFEDEEDDELPAPMTLEEVIRRSKISPMEEDGLAELDPGNEVEMEMEMDEEELRLVEEGMRASSFEETEDKKTEIKTAGDDDDDDPPMRIVKNWKRPEERDPTNFAVSPITGELVPISEMSEHIRISLIDPKFKEQKNRMFAKIRETTLANDDEISRNIVGLARTRPDIFGTTEEEVSNAVKAEMEKKSDDIPKQVIWDGQTGSIGRTANQTMSQNFGGEDQHIPWNYDGRSFPGPTAPPPMQMQMMVWPPPHPMQMQMMQMHPGQPMMMNQSIPVPQQHFMIQPNIPVPQPPGSQFTPLGIYNPCGPAPPLPPTGMTMAPPPPVEAPPPLPEEPEPKRQKLEDSMLIPEDQFLAQHPGLAQITISVVSVPSVDDQVLEIIVQSLSETIGSLKEKISGEIQYPANKQKLSGKAGVLKDNFSLAYYNVASGESLTLSFRERGGRKR